MCEGHKVWRVEEEETGHARQRRYLLWGSGEADLLLDFIVSWKVVCVKGETSCLVLQSRLYDEHGGKRLEGMNREGDEWDVVER